LGGQVKATDRSTDVILREGNVMISTTKAILVRWTTRLQRQSSGINEEGSKVLLYRNAGQKNNNSSSSREGTALFLGLGHCRLVVHTQFGGEEGRILSCR
jgi:hypothetical protein